MLIINADDWGGWPSATDAALECYRLGALRSVSAMVFMQDSERAAGLADDGLDVGLHLNFTQRFDGPRVDGELLRHQDRVRAFLTRSKYAVLLYHPLLNRSFRVVCEAQMREFDRLYGKKPTHYDGHQHMHLCLNMVLHPILPAGERVRRSFTFAKGEKSEWNRKYRSWIDRRLATRHKLTDSFFSLETALRQDRVQRVLDEAKNNLVELMTHPEKPAELAYFRQSVGKSLREQAAMAAK